jgi:hypothetical protein
VVGWLVAHRPAPSGLAGGVFGLPPLNGLLQAVAQRLPDLGAVCLEVAKSGMLGFAQESFVQPIFGWMGELLFELREVLLHGRGVYWDCGCDRDP